MDNKQVEITRLPFTAQQIVIVKQSQQALAQAQAQANFVIVNIFAAAGIDSAKPLNINFDESYLEIELS